MSNFLPLPRLIDVLKSFEVEHFEGRISRKGMCESPFPPLLPANYASDCEYCRVLREGKQEHEAVNYAGLYGLFTDTDGLGCLNFPFAKCILPAHTNARRIHTFLLMFIRLHCKIFFAYINAYVNDVVN